MKVNTIIASLNRAIDNAEHALRGTVMSEEQALTELIRTAKTALLELESSKRARQPIMEPLEKMANQWLSHWSESSFSSPYYDGAKDGMTRAATDLLDWIQRNG